MTLQAVESYFVCFCIIKSPKAGKHIVHFYFKLVMRQLIYPNSCIRLITCENGYFAVDDVALIYATSVQRLTLKRKRREY